MSDAGKFAKNIERFRQAVRSHDELNPTHTAYGIGLSFFDMERLDLEEGEILWSGIHVECDGKASGNFRVLCDGAHDEASGLKQEEEKVDAVSKEEIVNA